MSQRKTVTCPNPDVLAQAVAVRVLTTIRNLLAEPGRSRVDIALTGGTDGQSRAARDRHRPAGR